MESKTLTTKGNTIHYRFPTLLLGSDAHRPVYVGYMFEEIIEKFRKWGLSHLCIYEKREQKLIKI